jgi:hypothetical protein
VEDTVHAGRRRGNGIPVSHIAFNDFKAWVALMLI